MARFASIATKLNRSVVCWLTVVKSNHSVTLVPRIESSAKISLPIFHLSNEVVLSRKRLSWLTLKHQVNAGFSLGALERAGTANVLTRDLGTSQLTEGPIAISCLVEVERFQLGAMRHQEER